MGLMHLPMNLKVLPSIWTRILGDVVFEKTYGSGGHFIAYKKPEHLIADLREMFGRGGGAEEVVEECSGYSSDGEFTTTSFRVYECSSA
jgi:hypothetical protein